MYHWSNAIPKNTKQLFSDIVKEYQGVKNFTLVPRYTLVQDETESIIDQIELNIGSLLMTTIL